MFITKTKTKDSTIYYLSKSFRDKTTNKVSTKIVEKIGSQEEIQNRIGKNKNIDKWLKEYAVKKTEEEKNTDADISITLDPNSRIQKSDKRIFNAGYLIIQKILYEIGLDKICRDIENKENFKADLFQIISYIIYTYQVNYEKTIDTLTFSQYLIESPKFNRRQLHLAFEIIAKYAYKIENILFENINKLYKTDYSIFYYDTKNFYHDFINAEEDFENINDNDKIVKYELGINSNNLPIAFAFDRQSGNYDKYDYEMANILLEKYMNSNTLALSSFDNPYTSLIVSERRRDAQPIRWVEIRSLDKELKSWIKNNEDWIEVNTQKKYDISDVKAKIKDPKILAKHNSWMRNARFYKTKKIDWTDPKTKEVSKKILVAVYSNQIREEKLKTGKLKIENIHKNINIQLFKHEHDKKYCYEYLKKYEKYITINEDEFKKDSPNMLHLFTFKNDFLARLSDFSDYYAVLIDPSINNINEAIKIQTSKWVADYTFCTVGKDFYHFPKYIPYEDRIICHMFLSYLGLLTWRILLMKCNYKFTDNQLINALYDFNFIYFKGEGWIPIYDINKVTDFFHDLLVYRTDYNFISDKSMNKILNSYKNTK